MYVIANIADANANIITIAYSQICFGMGMSDIVIKINNKHIIKLILHFALYNIQYHFYSTRKMILHSVLPRTVVFSLCNKKYIALIKMQYYYNIYQTPLHILFHINVVYL